jgi:hypothetical protein
MPVNSAFGNVVSLLQEANQFNKRIKLPVCGRIAVEITDEANSNTFFVCPVAWGIAGVSAGQLAAPTEGRFDLSVSAVRSVADNKIITDTIPALFTMPFVDYGGVAFIGGGMMNYNCRPGPVGS